MYQIKGKLQLCNKAPELEAKGGLQCLVRVIAGLPRVTNGKSENYKKERPADITGILQASPVLRSVKVVLSENI